MMSRHLFFLFVLVSLVSAGNVCARESAPEPTAPAEEGVSVEDLEDLVDRLEDPERRAQLVTDLKALVELQRREAEEEEAEVVSGPAAFFRDLSRETRETVSDLLEQLGAIPAAIRGLWTELQDPAYQRALLLDVAWVAGIVVAALLAGFLLWLLLRRFRRRIAEGPSRELRNVGARLWRLLVLTLLDALPPALILAMGFVGIAVVGPPRAAAGVASALIWAVALKHLIVAVARGFLAPESPRLRLLPMSDAMAQGLDGWVRRLTTIGVYGYYALVALEALGVDPLLVQALWRLLGLVVLVLSIVMILKHRDPAHHALSERLHKTDEKAKGWRSAVLSMASLWWILAILYLVGLYVIWAGGIAEGSTLVIRATGLTLVAVLAGLAVAALGRWLVGRILGLMRPMRERFPEVGTSIDRYEAGLRLLVNIAVSLLSFCFVLEAWGIDALGVLSSETAQTLFSVVVSILVILLLAAATIDVATILTQRYLESKERSGRATAKTRTILPLAHKAIKTIVIVLAAIMVLSEAGVNIGPLLAGVGVLGLAVGFGAQTLVKDIITGVFMLMEDTVSVGDVAIVNGTGGVVEAINIRTMRLRDLSANVHTIPYSTIGTITNMTKDFSRYLLEVGVAYREDTDEVVALLKELDAQMREDPDFKNDITAPIEILGVDRFEDSAVIVRARLTTKPSQQWRTGREFNRRMKKLFDERGIEIPFPHRTVYWGEAKDGSEPPLRVLPERSLIDIDTAAKEPSPSGANAPSQKKKKKAARKPKSSPPSSAPSAEDQTEGDEGGSVGR